jgi:hypothetical protein
VLRIGSIPYVDHDVAASNEAGRSRDVVLVHTESGWKARVEGFADGSLPPAERDRDRAIHVVRRFIHRNGGSGLKRPQIVQSRQRSRAEARKAQERSARRRPSRER